MDYVEKTKKDKIKGVKSGLKAAALKAKLPSAKSGKGDLGTTALSGKAGIMYTPKAEMDVSKDMESNEAKEVEKQHGSSKALKKSIQKLKKSRYTETKNGNY